MKVVVQAAYVIGVRVAHQEGVDVKTVVVVALEPVLQVLRDIRRVVVFVIGCAANIQVDEDGLPVVELQENDVPVGNGKESDGCAHGLYPSGFVLIHK